MRRRGPVIPQSRPVVSRKFGRFEYETLDHLPAASLGRKELGKVEVDCRFRLSKSKWGFIGPYENPAGIVYMDLKFDQPKDCRLAKATVTVTLESAPDDELLNRRYRTAPNTLQITEQYGPKRLCGELKSMPVKTSYHFTPNVNILGNGFGGLGVNTERFANYTSKWEFSGNLSTAKDKRRGGSGTRTVYRTLKWELTENELESQPGHNSIIQTGFTFEHEGEPFYMRVEIDGKLEKTSERMKKLLKFPSTINKKDGSTLTRIDLGGRTVHRRNLDRQAEVLPWEMEQANLKTLAVTMPNSLPVSYHDIPPSSNDTQVPEAIQAQQSEPFTISDPTEPSIENLTKPLLAFFDASITDASRSMPDGGSIRSSSGGRLSQATTEVPEGEAEGLIAKKQETVARVSQFPALLFIVHMLAYLIDAWGL